MFDAKAEGRLKRAEMTKDIEKGYPGLKRAEMTKDIEKGYPGQSFDDYLKEQGAYEITTEQAVKRVLAFQLAEAMEKQGISKAEMARRLRTSRSQLDRLLDLGHDGVTVGVLARAAKAVGRELRLELA